jgi:hypothetical protein
VYEFKNKINLLQNFGDEWSITNIESKNKTNEFFFDSSIRRITEGFYTLGLHFEMFRN